MLYEKIKIQNSKLRHGEDECSSCAAARQKVWPKKMRKRPREIVSTSVESFLRKKSTNILSEPCITCEHNRECGQLKGTQQSISDMQEKLSKVKSQIKNTSEARRKIFSLEHELIQEQCKLKLVEDELNNPMNV